MKMGRPRLAIPKNRSISMRLTEEEYNAIKRMAEEQNKTPTKYAKDKALTK